MTIASCGSDLLGSDEVISCLGNVDGKIVVCTGTTRLVANMIYADHAAKRSDKGTETEGPHTLLTVSDTGTSTGTEIVPPYNMDISAVPTP